MPSSPLTGVVVVVLVGAVDSVALDDDDDDPSGGNDVVTPPRADPSPATVGAIAPTVVDTMPVTGAVAPATV